MWTTRSINSRPCASRSFSLSRGARGPPPRLLLIGFPSFLELQAALAGGVGQCADFAVVDVPAAIEYDLRDALLLRAHGNELADALRGRDVRAGLVALAKLRLHRGGVGDGVA